MIRKLFSDGLSVVLMVDIVLSRLMVLLVFFFGIVLLMKVMVRVIMMVVLRFCSVCVVISNYNVGVMLYRSEVSENSEMLINSSFLWLMMLFSCFVLIIRVVMVSR